MSKFIKTGMVLSGIILFGAGCARGRAPQTPAADVSVSLPGPTSVASEAVIEYRDGLFNPSTLRVLVGTTVTFVNKGNKEVWPASGRHPAHDICPGFDALQSLKNGETYSYLFDKEAECPFHNHVAPGEKGSIEVKAAE